MSSSLWNKKINCPFCKFEFETSRMRSSVIKIKEKMTDFGNIYEGECAYLYAVTVCPNCTFAALNKDFDSIRPDYETKVMEASKMVRESGKKKPEIFGLGPMAPEVSLKRHELAIAFTKMRSYSALGTLAGLYMHLVWINRLRGDLEREKAAMAEAVKAYKDYHEKGGDLPEKLGEPGILYLIGELHRRLGDYREARNYYGRALASKEIRSFPAIADMTRDMMLAAKTAMEKASMTEQAP
ncbi:MAG TPA: DUF2225 domain-containing protein [bacterium]|nr:DUF2225 domain-containing protein [bacterium]